MCIYSSKIYILYVRPSIFMMYTAISVGLYMLKRMWTCFQCDASDSARRDGALHHQVFASRCPQVGPMHVRILEACSHSGNMFLFQNIYEQLFAYVFIYSHIHVHD